MEEERQEEEGVCGDTYDHEVVVDAQSADGLQWHCARPECGVEVWDPTPISE